MEYKLPPLPEKRDLTPFSESRVCGYAEADMRAYAIAAIEARCVPDIDYEALIEAAHKRDRKWAQGTNGCIAFKCGAEWFRDQVLASAPPAPQASEVQQEPVASAMTAQRAAYFMERFKHEEKLLGPNEQAALDFVLSMLYTHPAQQAKPLSDEQSRELAEQHYVCSQWYGADLSTGIGSRQWCVYWDGWRAAHGIKGN